MSKSHKQARKSLACEWLRGDVLRFEGFTTPEFAEEVDGAGAAAGCAAAEPPEEDTAENFSWAGAAA